MKIILLPIGYLLEAIIWLFKPRLYRVGTDIDENFAKHLLKYGGAKLVNLTPPRQEE